MASWSGSSSPVQVSYLRFSRRARGCIAWPGSDEHEGPRFLVLGGVAPMAVIVALLPLSIGRGVGAGVPGTYLIAGAVLALLAVGYARMSRRITNAGTFYAYAARGLGRVRAVRRPMSHCSPTTRRRLAFSMASRISPMSLVLRSSESTFPGNCGRSPRSRSSPSSRTSRSASAPRSSGRSADPARVRCQRPDTGGLSRLLARCLRAEHRVRERVRGQLDGACADALGVRPSGAE